LGLFAPPEPGDIVYCRFPEKGLPGPAAKPRPALVLTVGEIDGNPHVAVAYGTSQNTDRLHSGEFLIGPADGEAYTLSGLSLPTKFDLRSVKELPYDEQWFRVPPGAPHGQTPRLGVLHPSLMRRAKAAFDAAAGTGGT
jgi:hypothetical protein